MESQRDKQVVLMGHSKGGCDLVAAVVLYPQLQERVRAVVCVQAPLGGSPLPAEMFDGGFVSVAAQLLKPCDPRALRDLSYTARCKFWADFVYPYERIPTLTLATHALGSKGSMLGMYVHKH